MLCVNSLEIAKLLPAAVHKALRAARPDKPAAMAEPLLRERSLR